nr:mads-box protein agl42 [Quercus suber]
MQQLKGESEIMSEKIELIQISQRKLLGYGLSSCTLDELQEIDSQLERSLRSIRARKAELFMEQIEHLKAKERLLKEENERLCHQVNPFNISCCLLLLPAPSLRYMMLVDL